MANIFKFNGITGVLDLTCTGGAGTGTVTSVDMAVPSFLSIAGNPITDTGTLTIGYSGTALPIANGGTGSTNGSITGSTALSFTAGGSNQNITFTPTGTGFISLSGKLTSPFAQTWTLANNTSALNIDANTLNIDATNHRVGIGVASPTSNLHVFGSVFPVVTNHISVATNGTTASVTRLLRSNGTGGANDGVGLIFSLNNSASTITNYALISGLSTTATSGSEAGALTFSTLTGGSLSEKGRFSATGNFGIGTITPGAPLQVSFLAANAVTSGTVNAVQITPSYNQATGTAANTDLLINRTQTAVGSGAQRLIDAQVGGTSFFAVDNFGKTIQSATNTAAGTTGAQTINKPTGTVNFAAGATSLVVTNSLVSTSSIVMAVIRTNDATAILKNVVPAAGSFTITLNAAATAETSVGFRVQN